LFHLVLESHDGRAPGADSEEKHEPVSDIDTVVVDSLKALDPEWPIREADMGRIKIPQCTSLLTYLDVLSFEWARQRPNAIQNISVLAQGLFGLSAAG
jgi:hypothetical protein